MAARSTMSLDDRITIATHMLSPERRLRASVAMGKLAS